MIRYRQIDETYFEAYDKIPMLVHVKSIYRPQKINAGLGGVLFEEVRVEEYTKDMSIYEVATKYTEQFDITNWAFFMAFDEELPIGAVTVVSKTETVNMLDGRDDMSVLWDIRVDDRYKKNGVGTALFQMAVAWSKARGLKQIKIECQNTNVPACKFYAKQGAVLGAINEYAYYLEKDVYDEIQLIWYRDI